jgi:hypothetical protein
MVQDVYHSWSFGCPSVVHLLKLAENLHHLVPKLLAASVHVAIQVADDLGIGSQAKPAENNPAGFRHDFLCGSHGVIDFFGGRFDQQGIVDRSTDAKPLLGRLGPWLSGLTGGLAASEQFPGARNFGDVA